jgi:Uma2 family endonuclease
VIIEVLSDSTEAYDRGEKFEHYQQVESLSEYLLVSQHACRVERYLRQDQKSWLYSEAHELEESLEIESIACMLALRDVYDKVDLAQSPERSLHRLR